MIIHSYPTEGVIQIEDFEGEEAELIMALTYLRGMMIDPPLGIDEAITGIMYSNVLDS